MKHSPIVYDQRVSWMAQTYTHLLILLNLSDGFPDVFCSLVCWVEEKKVPAQALNAVFLKANRHGAYFVSGSASSGHYDRPRYASFSVVKNCRSIEKVGAYERAANQTAKHQEAGW
ncbi:hypothetical protein [Pseudomonas savastanoi]|uniref:hypothetical protein n=1 Tax=Pseudomonas savastanoi TaxID=29438 RepID=UPI00217FCB4A|nr:hypothetical protein [Pseudomonas savastanoi]